MPAIPAFAISGPDADERDGHAHLLLEHGQVGAGGIRELVPLGQTGQVHLPHGQLLVDGRGLVQVALVVRQVLDPLAVDVVGHADLDRGQGVEHVELGQGQLGQRVEPHGVAGHDGVEPARPATATGVGAVLVAPVDEQVAGLVEQLGGERPGADAGDVGLGDADDPVDVHGADAGPGAGTAGHRVRRRDVGVRPVVEVEEGRLGALEQDLLAGVEGLVDEADRVGDERLDAGPAHLEVLLAQVVEVEGQLVVDLGQHGVLLAQRGVELLAEDLGVEQVLDPDADAARLVGVGRADAPLGGADLVLAQPPLGDLVDLLVVREDQVGVAPDLHAGRVDALALEHVELGDQHAGVDDDPVADHGGDVVVEHAGGHQLEGEGLAVDHDGVAGVVPALVADHQVHLLGDEVGELPLALIAPLGPDDDGRWHELELLRRRRLTRQP